MQPRGVQPSGARSTRSEAIDMAASKRNVPVTKRVWRISAATPSGEFVTVDGVRSSPPKVDALPDGGWVESSYDLARGLEVREIRVAAATDPAPKKRQNP